MNKLTADKVIHDMLASLGCMLVTCNFTMSSVLFMVSLCLRLSLSQTKQSYKTNHGLHVQNTSVRLVEVICVSELS